MGRAWITLLLLGCASCSLMKSDAQRLLDREITGEVLFEWYAVDMTWGYKLSGMYINADGTVWAYEQTGTPWYPDRLKQGELSQHDMLTKHKDAHQIGTVDRELLHDMAKMIKPAAQGHITRVGGSNAGDGSLQVAFLLDPDDSIYHEIILSGTGNRVANNSAAQAVVLSNYLREVARLVEWSGAPK